MAATKSDPKRKTKTATIPPAATAKKKPSDSKAPNYTKPALRQRLKDEIQAGNKGGRPVQWSAQLLAAEYEKQGGGYKQAKRTSQQKHLEAWTEEKWQTTDGKKATRGQTTARYLPAKAWDKLTPAQRKATDEKHGGKGGVLGFRVQRGGSPDRFRQSGGDGQALPRG